jgi:hypothetical protein
MKTYLIVHGGREVGLVLITRGDRNRARWGIERTKRLIEQDGEIRNSDVGL